MKRILYTILIVTILMVGCATIDIDPKEETATPITPVKTPKPTDEGFTPIADETDFEDNDNGYHHGFADYPVGEDEFYELNAGVGDIPDLLTKGYLLSGNNHSDDLLMYIAKTYDVKPNVEYKISLVFDVATNVPGGMMGVGGSPGTSVFVKAGASSRELDAKEVKDGYFRVNWDIGNQSSDGTDGNTLGNIEKIDSVDESYQLKNFETEWILHSNEDGQLHIMIAIDSGFESVSKVYIDNIFVSIS